MTLALQHIDERISVSGQLDPEDMKEIAAAGYATVVNNRPNGEAMFGQPATAALRQAAEAAGMVFLDLPFAGPQATPAQVRALADVLATGNGKVAAFCKSGMRSTLLWGAASLANGRPLEEVLSGARRAGHNLDPAAELMTSLAAQARR